MDASMTFKVSIDDKRQYDVKLGEMLAIKEESMNRHLAEHPSQYAFVAMIQALSRAKLQRMQSDFELAEAQFTQDLREAAAKDSVKLTEKAIESETLTNKRLLAMRRELISAQEQTDFCSAAAVAFSHRKDCLITLAANLRSQDPTMSINR